MEELAQQFKKTKHQRQDRNKQKDNKPSRQKNEKQKHLVGFINITNLYRKNCTNNTNAQNEA